MPTIRSTLSTALVVFLSVVVAALAALDSHLNERGYIVPGLGDAGDRQFGTFAGPASEPGHGPDDETAEVVRRLQRNLPQG